MCVDVERKLLPLGCPKALVLRQGAAARVGGGAVGAAIRKLPVFNRSEDCMTGELELLAGRRCQMHRPIEESAGERGWRQAAGHSCNAGTDCMIDVPAVALPAPAPVRRSRLR